MAYDPALHHRRSIRLPAYDYSLPGAYFITICVHQRRPFFGEIDADQMILSKSGQMVDEAWTGLKSRFQNCEIDSFVIMPNHLHGIIVLNATGDGDLVQPAGPQLKARATGTMDGSLARLIQAFKSITTNEYIRAVRSDAWPAFEGHLWQPNYFEHVIRNEKSLLAIREYIVSNPMRWGADAENPNGGGTDDVETWVQGVNDLVVTRDS